jgi:hypothetical protein
MGFVYQHMAHQPRTELKLFDDRREGKPKRGKGGSEERNFLSTFAVLYVDNC